MTKNQLEVVLKEVVSINSTNLRPEVLVGLPGSHVLELHNSQKAWKDLVVFVSDKAGVNIPIIEGTSKCRLEAVPGQRIYLYGIPAPQGRCSYMELLLNEILSTKQDIAIRGCYSSISDHVCATMSFQIIDEVHKIYDT